MFAFAHMLEFLSNKLARLCRRSFALLRVSAGTFDYFFFWIEDFLSNQRRAWKQVELQNDLNEKRVNQGERPRNQAHSFRCAKLL
jgi:hypothetical protein